MEMWISIAFCKLLRNFGIKAANPDFSILNLWYLAEAEKLKKKYAESLYRTPSKEDPHTINLKFTYVHKSKDGKYSHIYFATWSFGSKW